MLSKPMYNIKIKNGQDLYGLKQFKLRPDIMDPTLLRTKLISDIRNRVGIKSISANYSLLYINDQFMGLYILTDLINLSWIKNTYCEKKTSTLYKCDRLDDFTLDYSDGCKNKNEEITDHTEWINFLKSIENAKSASDLEAIFDIDHFLYEMAIDYLTSATDHKYHNFYMYKQPNDKWAYISYDFDLDFIYDDDTFDISDEEYIKTIAGKGRLYDILISQDHERFNTILKDVVNRVYNPAILFPHIDEIKQFIKPYVILDKTPDSNGKYPGTINENIIYKAIYTIDEWDEYSELTISNNDIGLKYLILMKYKNVCNTQKMECDPIYMDENYLSNNLKFMKGNHHKDHNEYNSSITEYETQTEIRNELFEKEIVYEIDELIFSTDDESSFDE